MTTFLALLLSLSSAPWEPTQSRDTLVLLIDFQHDFASSAGAWPADSLLARQAMESARRLVRTAHSRGWPVARVANAFSPWDPGNLFRHGAAVRGRPGARWVLDDTLPGEPFFTKRGPDAFRSDSLAAWFSARPGSVVWVAGFFAEGCVTSTACSALGRGHRVLSHPSLVASPDSVHWRCAWEELREVGVEESSAF